MVEHCLCKSSLVRPAGCETGTSEIGNSDTLKLQQTPSQELRSCVHGYPQSSTQVAKYWPCKDTFAYDADQCDLTTMLLNLWNTPSAFVPKIGLRYDQGPSRRAWPPDFCYAMMPDGVWACLLAQGNYRGLRRAVTQQQCLMKTLIAFPGFP